MRPFQTNFSSLGVAPQAPLTSKRGNLMLCAKFPRWKENSRLPERILANPPYGEDQNWQMLFRFHPAQASPCRRRRKTLSVWPRLADAEKCGASGRVLQSRSDANTGLLLAESVSGHCRRIQILPPKFLSFRDTQAQVQAR